MIPAKEIAIAAACAYTTACAGRCANHRASKSSSICATAGSPSQPSAREANVTPNCTAGRNSSILRFSASAVRAPGRFSASSCCMRVALTLTMANSAATKKLLARMKKATISTRKSTNSIIQTESLRENARQHSSHRASLRRQTFLHQNLRDGLVDRVLRHIAHDLLGHLAALEQQQSRNPADSVPHRRGGIRVHVHLHHLQLAVVVRGHLIHYWRQRAARAAPRRPEVHQNRLLRLQYFLLKVRIVHGRHKLSHLLLIPLASVIFNREALRYCHHNRCACRA